MFEAEIFIVQLCTSFAASLVCSGLVKGIFTVQELYIICSKFKGVLRSSARHLNMFIVQHCISLAIREIMFRSWDIFCTAFYIICVYIGLSWTYLLHNM